MPTYRIVWRDKRRHIADVKDIDCHNDEDATTRATNLVFARDVELYEHGRFIAFLPAKTNAARNNPLT